MKPMLASDYNEAKLKFPILMQPKIDGVRGWNVGGRLVGRSLKTHANKYVTALLSQPELEGLDGELAAEHECHPDLCRITTSAMSSIHGEPFVLWWLFDWVTPATADLPYDERYDALMGWVLHLQSQPEFAHFAGQLRVVPRDVVNNLERLNELDTHWLDMGYEGSIIRDPNGKHKQGRSTVREGGLLRVKRFEDAEAVVIEIVEGNSNQNEAQINELGQQFRSSHAEGMVASGRVGSMICRNLSDGETITVGPGRMTADERVYFWNNSSELIGKTIKYQHFPKGVKDKPRFPTFQSIRATSDIGV